MTVQFLAAERSVEVLFVPVNGVGLIQKEAVLELIQSGTVVGTIPYHP